MDSRGNLFFGVMDPPAMACWDSSKPYTKANIRTLPSDPNLFQFAGGVKVVQNKRMKREELWVLSNRFQVKSTL